MFPFKGIEWLESKMMSSWASECWISPTFNVREDNLKFYPNPSTKHITIESPNVNLVGFSLIVYDISGQRIKNSFLKNHIHIQDIAVLNAGIYFYQIVSPEGKLIKSGKTV